MKAKRYWFVVILALAALILLPAQIGRSQTDVVAPAPEAANEAAALITPVMSYQGRLVEFGAPVTGARAMIFKLYTAAPTGGTLVWQEGPKTISVTNGLFYTTLGDATPFDTTVMNSMDQNLWLEVTVEGVPLPRVRLMGSPYAFSLAPGADVEGAMAAGQSVLKAQNTGAGWGFLGQSASSYGVYGNSDTGHGVYASSSGVGLDGSALLAQAETEDGIAAWALSKSNDTTLVASNDGAGPLFKGFGGDGGEHEIVILNDGTVQQDRSASGLVKAGVYASCSNSGSTVKRSFNNVGGTITIANGASVGTCTIDFGFQVDDLFFSSQSWGAGARFVTCYPSAPTSLNCYRFDADGSGISGDIMVIIY